MKPIRWLFLTHRYLGIAVGLLMVMWCLSGIVMMYVRYPELPEAQRLKALQPIDWRGCCIVSDALDASVPVTAMRIEMLAGRPVMRIAQTSGNARLIDLTDGLRVARVSADQARAVALTYGGRPGIPELVARDQWTVAGGFREDRPLYRFAFDDTARTRLYVSSTTGKAVQITTRAQRIWNWLGAIPHWLYFTRLRADVALWSQVVIWTSLLGCFLAGTGLYLGIRQLVTTPNRWSPYRGFMLWHHLPGLIFGVFVLSWVASGLVSMNPWGFLDSDGKAQQAARLSGDLSTGAQIAVALPALATAAQPGIVSIAVAPFDGALAFIATTTSGERRRIDAHGKIMPPPDMARAAEILGGEGRLIAEGDAYYFDSRSEAASLPVYRVTAGGVLYYLDPVSGAVVKTVDANGRRYRWLHEGVHRLDFSPGLRRRPLWDILMLTLMFGVIFVCGTGAWLGLRRLVRNSQP